MKKYASLLLWIVILEVLGSLSGYPKGAAADVWYQTIQKSPLTPPSIVFPIVWIVLYAMIATCGWLIWQKENKADFKSIKIAYVFQLILNLSWTSIFFYLNWVGVGFVIILLITILTAYIVCTCVKKCRVCSLLLLPYLIWLVFASYLNYYIWIHN